MIYMHKNSLDVALKVYKLREYKPGFVDIKGCWLNLGYEGNPWKCSDVMKYRIPLKDFKENWVNITDLIHEPRQKAGLPE